jgi:hypothetical protein
VWSTTWIYIPMVWLTTGIYTCLSPIILPRCDQKLVYISPRCGQQLVYISPRCNNWYLSLTGKPITGRQITCICLERTPTTCIVSLRGSWELVYIPEV